MCKKMHISISLRCQNKQEETSAKRHMTESPLYDGWLRTKLRIQVAGVTSLPIALNSMKSACHALRVFCVLSSKLSLTMQYHIYYRLSVSAMRYASLQEQRGSRQSHSVWTSIGRTWSGFHRHLEPGRWFVNSSIPSRMPWHPCGWTMDGRIVYFHLRRVASLCHPNWNCTIRRTIYIWWVQTKLIFQ